MTALPGLIDSLESAMRVIRAGEIVTDPQPSTRLHAECLRHVPQWYYDALRKSKPTDKRTLPVALLKRAMADIPRIEQLERDHPRMARLFNTGLLPFSIWEQLLEAEAVPLDQRTLCFGRKRVEGETWAFVPEANSYSEYFCGQAPVDGAVPRGNSSIFFPREG